MDREVMTKQIVRWIAAHPLINVSALNRCSNLPTSKLKEVIAGRQLLKENQILSLLPHLISYGFEHWQPRAAQPPNNVRTVAVFKDRFGTARWEVGFFGQRHMIPREGEVDVTWRVL